MLPVNQLYLELGFSDAGVTNTFNQESNTVISRISRCLPAGLPKFISASRIQIKSSHSPAFDSN